MSFSLSNIFCTLLEENKIFHFQVYEIQVYLAISLVHVVILKYTIFHFLVLVLGKEREEKRRRSAKKNEAKV